MKLRLREGSIRLRLTRGEVDRVRDHGRVDEVLEVSPGATIGWSLAVHEGDVVRAVHESGVLRVDVPRALASEWWTTDRVGFEAMQSVGDRSLKILVEKDWSCLKPRDDEDDADAYPHPLAKKT
jgi:hypothetical protein